MFYKSLTFSYKAIIERKIPRAQDPPNSEVSEEFLKRFAGSPSTIRDFEKALKRGERGEFVPLEYDELKQDFKLVDLVC